MQVRFRNASSFLVAYTVNLSRGGVFLETEENIEVGTEISLQLEVPGSGPVAIAGRVTWRRDVPDEDGPAGIGIEFDDMVDPLGEVIDRLIADFTGLTVLLVCPEGRERVALTRHLRSMISTAEVVAAPPESASSLVSDDIDLVVLDLDCDRQTGLTILHAAGSLANPVPCVVLSDDETARAQAKHVGRSDVIGNPASFADLHQSVMRSLGRPTAVRTR